MNPKSSHFSEASSRRGMRQAEHDEFSDLSVMDDRFPTEEDADVLREAEGIAALERSEGAEFEPLSVLIVPASDAGLLLLRWSPGTNYG